MFGYLYFEFRKEWDFSSTSSFFEQMLIKISRNFEKFRIEFQLLDKCLHYVTKNDFKNLCTGCKRYIKRRSCIRCHPRYIVHIQRLDALC